MVDVKSVAKRLKALGMTKANDVEDPVDFVSSNNAAIDLISDGGVPFGHVVEFLGLSQSGKSLFIQQLIANAQKKYGAIGVLIDRENAYTNKRGEQLGIDNDRLWLAKPNNCPTVLDAFNLILESVASIRGSEEEQKKKEYIKEYIVVGIDSISAFGKDVALEKSDSGRKAKSTHEGLRELLTIMDERVLLVVANQVTYKVGVMYGDPRTSSSGESMKYYSTVRFALEDRHKIIDKSKGNEVIGNWIGVEVIKTRLGPCYRTCYVPHYYETGIPYYGGYARLLVDRGYLYPKNKKEFDSFNGKTIIYERGETKEQFSEDNVEKLFEAHPELKFDKYPEYNKEKQTKTEEEE
jgi:recombination protein RecA